MAKSNKLRIEATTNGWLVYILGPGGAGSEVTLGRYCFTREDSLLAFLAAKLPAPAITGSDEP